MDSRDQDTTYIVEKTTTLVYESAVVARRKRMEIRRFKKFSSVAVSPRSLNSVYQGGIKRTRPLRTSSICSLCYYGKDGEDNCDRFWGGLARSKSFPIECMHTGRCFIQISKASRDHAAMNLEGHSVIAVHDKEDGNGKGASAEFCPSAAEATSNIDPIKATILPSNGSTEPTTMAALLGHDNVSGLNSGASDAEVTKAGLKFGEKARFSTSGHSIVDAHVVDSVDRNNVTAPGSAHNVTSSSSMLIAPQHVGRCPLSGKVLVCGRRREMEDTATIIPSFTQIPCLDTLKESCDLHFFAVYDGHGGAQASNFCAGRFHHALAEVLATSPLREGMEDDTEWKNVMDSCFQKMDQEIGGICPSGACDEASGSSMTCCVDAIAPENVGTTAVLAVFSPSKIIVANCGDSRAVLSRGGIAIPVSKDHKPERADETARIEAAGGRVIYWDGHRVSGLLALSRALGDRYLKQFVISEPDVLCLPRTDDDECLILASDGLWDVISNETACDVARRCFSSARKRSDHRRSRTGEDTASAAAAALLVKLAYGRGSKDNISVIVIDLKSRKLQGS